MRREGIHTGEEEVPNLSGNWTEVLTMQSAVDVRLDRPSELREGKGGEKKSA